MIAADPSLATQAGNPYTGGITLSDLPTVGLD